MTTIFKCSAASALLATCALMIGCATPHFGKNRNANLSKKSHSTMIPERIETAPDHREPEQQLDYFQPVSIGLPGTQAADAELPFAGNVAGLLGSYVIETGDNLEIKFRGTPELNEHVIVRPDGMISLPLVGDQSAAGMTPEQLRGLLNSAYASELRKPDITVIVRSFSGNSVYIGGEVLAPGRVNLTARLTTLNAVILAGGFKDTADPRRIVVRRADGSCCEYDLKSVIECKGGQNIVLQPYDVVYVPKSKIAKVNLFVEQYIDKVLPFSRSVGIFVSHNTGLTAAATGP